VGFFHSRSLAFIAAAVFGICLVFGAIISRTDHAGAQVSVTTTGPDDSSPGAAPPPDPTLGQALNDPAAPVVSANAPAATPEASSAASSDEATQSGEPDSPYADDTLSEARALAAQTFSDDFAELDQDPLRALSSTDVVKFLDDNVARVNPPGSDQSALVQSTIPLRDQNDNGQLKPIDLSVGDAAGHLEPANPLVDVTLPNDASQPMELQGADVGVSLQSPEAAVAQATPFGDGKLFYHEAAKDTDLIVAPVSQGFELMAQVRSPDAPEGLSLRVSLPQGATLQQVDEGVEVTHSGERIALITAPVAVDAAGRGLATRLTVADADHLNLIVEHRSSATEYPVLVDPVTEDWTNHSWQWHNNTNKGGWWDTSWAPGGYSAPWTSFGSPASHSIAGYNNWGGGLYAQAGSGWQIGQGNGAQWVYNTLGTAYIKSANLTTINFARNGENNYDRPYAFWGVYSTPNEDWGHNGDNETPLTAWSGTGLTSANWQAANLTEDDQVNEVVFGMGNSAARINSQKLTAARTASLGGITIVVGDAEAATVDNVTQSPEAPLDWTDSYQGSATVSASDGDPDNGYGLGVYSIGLSTPTPSGESWTYAYGPPAPNYKNACDGTRGNPCPATLTRTLTYNTAQMAEGVDTVGVKATDAAGKSDPEATDQWEVKVDHTPPVLTDVSGSLKNGTGGDLHIHATDGDPSGPPSSARSGVASVELLIDGQVAQVLDHGGPQSGSWTQTCDEDSCAMDVNAKLDPFQYSDGNHQFAVRATDALGHSVTSSTWTAPVHDSFDTSNLTLDVQGAPFDPSPGGSFAGAHPDLLLTAHDPGTGGFTSMSWSLDGQEQETWTLDDMSMDGGHQNCSSTNCRLTYALNPDLSGFSPGSHTLLVKVTDSLGHTVQRSQAFQLDTSPPVLGLSGALKDSADAPLEATSAALNLTAGDPDGAVHSGISHLTVSIDDQPVFDQSVPCNGACPASASGTYTYTKAEFPPGPHEAKILISDLAGNVATAGFGVDVPPTPTQASCPEDPPQVLPTADPVNPQAALDAAQSEIPAAVASPTAATDPETGTTVDPGLEVTDPASIESTDTSDGGEAIKTTGGLTDGSTSTSASGGLSVGNLCLKPTVTTAAETGASLVDADAVTPTTPGADGDAAIYANTAPATDTIVQPTSDGATVIDDLRSGNAPDDFSYDVSLTEDQELMEMPDGSIAVVEPADTGTPPDAPIPPDPAGADDPSKLADTQVQMQAQAHDLAVAEAQTSQQVDAVITPEVVETACPDGLHWAVNATYPDGACVNSAGNRPYVDPSTCPCDEAVHDMDPVDLAVGATVRSGKKKKKTVKVHSGSYNKKHKKVIWRLAQRKDPKDCIDKPSPCGQYKRYQAADYAVKWSGCGTGALPGAQPCATQEGVNRNPDYLQGGNGELNCTNFISQSLRAGDIRFMNEYGSPNLIQAWWYKQGPSASGSTLNERNRNDSHSENWSVADDLVHHLWVYGLVNRGLYEQPHKWKVGQLIALDYNNPQTNPLGQFDHFQMIGAMSGPNGSVPLMSQEGEFNYNNLPWKYVKETRLHQGEGKFGVAWNYVPLSPVRSKANIGAQKRSIGSLITYNTNP
jgi:Putative amidase domain